MYQRGGQLGKNFCLEKGQANAKACGVIQSDAAAIERGVGNR